MKVSIRNLQHRNFSFNFVLNIFISSDMRADMFGGAQAKWKQVS